MAIQKPKRPSLTPFAQNKKKYTQNTHHHNRHFCQADSEDSDGSITTSPQQPTIKSGTPAPAHVKSTRSASSDSSTSESSASSSSAVRNTGATYTTQEVKQKLVHNTPTTTTATSAAATTTTPTSIRSRTVETPVVATPEKKPFQSRFLPNHQQEKKEETESSSEEETSSEESEEEEEEVPAAKPVVTTKPATVTPAAIKSDIGSLLTRSSQARESQAEQNRRNSRDETNLRGGYSSPTYNRSYEKEPSPKYTSSIRTRPTRDQYDEPKYGSSASTTGSSG